MIDLGRGCSRHRPVLIDFVDRGEVHAETEAALAHLDDCARCTAAIESTILTVTALRRMGDEAASLEPSADAWLRLRDRVRVARPSRIGLISPLTGMVMTTFVAALFLAPFRLDPNSGSDSYQPSETADFGNATEDVHTNSVRRGVDLPNSRSVTAPSGVQAKVIYPDGNRPPQKEVPEARSSTRPAAYR